MKEKSIFKADGDVFAIECNVFNAEIVVGESRDGQFTAEYPASKNIFIGSGKDGVIIRQSKRALFCNAPQRIEISVPAHTVPTLSVNGRTCRLSVNGGIYGDLTFSADDGKVSLSDCVFGNVSVTGGEVDAYLYGATVKNNIFLQYDRGELLAENTFATRTECRIKKGNIGLVNANCKECALDLQRGNVLATIDGAEQNFNTTLVTNEGTVSRESAKHDGAAGVFQAHSGKGNIVLDFIDKNSGKYPEETRSSQDIAGAIAEAAATTDREIV